MNLSKIIPILMIASALTACGKLENTSCKTSSGQTFSENAALIKKIAEQENAMGNNGFICQEVS